MINFRDDVLPLKNRLYRLALRITAHTGESEDIVQETIIRAWNHRDEFETGSSVEAFCVTVCKNLALDYIGKKESQNTALEDTVLEQADNAATPFQKLSHEDGKKWVYRLFQQLPDKQRIIMQLRDIEGKPYREIATLLNITEEQVKVTLFRARQKIKQEFEKIDNYGL